MGRREVQKPDFSFQNIYSTVNFISKNLFGAHTILAAAIDSSPGALTIPEQTLVGRITGGEIAALTPTQVRTLLEILLPDTGELYTTDHGVKWTDLGAISANEAQVLVALGNGIAILADLSDPSHVHRTTDYGATWTDLGAVLNSCAATGTYLGNGIVLLTDETGHIFRSTDYGVTWTDLGDQGTAFYVALYLGNGVAIAGNNSKHIFRSINFGVNWTDLGELTVGNIYAGAYLGNGIAILGDSTGRVVLSSNYGATWSDLGIIASGSIADAEYLGNGAALLCDDDGHIYRSDNYGATWTDLGEILSSYGSSFTYFGWGTVICTDGGGKVFRSSDFGLSWADLGVIAGSPILSSCFLGHGIALIGDSGSNIWRSTPAFGFGDFNPYQSELLLQFGCLGAITSNGTSYLAPGNGSTQTNEIKVRVPRAGILKNLHVQQRVASGASGRTDIYTVRVNGADKAITCTLDNATSGEDTTHAVPVAQGDAVSIKLVSNDASDASADVSATLVLV